MAWHFPKILATYFEFYVAPHCFDNSGLRKYRPLDIGMYILYKFKVTLKVLNMLK